MSENKPTGKTVKTDKQVEVIIPLGIQLANVAFWISGLSGLVLGVLTLTQSVYEGYYDLQILESVQGVAIIGLAAAMFVVATGLTSGARWALDAAKRVLLISIVWSILGIVLAVFTAINIPSVGFSIALYANMVWLIVFGIVIGIVLIRYLSLEDTSIRKYTEYVSTEVAMPEDVQRVSNTRYLPTYETRLQTRRPTVHFREFCWQCGAVMKKDETICPKCGAQRDVD
jgi:hypothetical protein